MRKILSCAFNLDTACVELRLDDGTPLSIENIAAMLGYRDSSNFYKAFREYYGKSPREYIKEE